MLAPPALALLESALDRALAGCRRLSDAATWLAGLALLAAAALVTVDVVARKLFALSIGGADELSGYALALVTSWGFGAALLARAHIRIDVLHRLAPAGIRAALDLSALAALSAVAALLAVFGWQVLEATLRRGSTANTPLQTPLWIPQGLWVAGLVFFVLVLAVLTLRTLAASARGDRAGMARLAGVRSTDEELGEARAAAVGAQPGRAA